MRGRRELRRSVRSSRPTRLRELLRRCWRRCDDRLPRVEERVWPRHLAIVRRREDPSHDAISIDHKKRRYRVGRLAVAMMLHETERSDERFFVVAQQRDFRAKKSCEHLRTLDLIGADGERVDAGVAKFVEMRG